MLSLRGIIPKYNQEDIQWEKLGRYISENVIACHSDGYSTYFDEEYKESDVEIAIPVDSLGESKGEFIYKEYYEIPLAAKLRFIGPFDGAIMPPAKNWPGGWRTTATALRACHHLAG